MSIQPDYNLDLFVIAHSTRHSNDFFVVGRNYRKTNWTRVTEKQYYQQAVDTTLELMRRGELSNFGNYPCVFSLNPLVDTDLVTILKNSQWSADVPLPEEPTCCSSPC